MTHNQLIKQVQTRARLGSRQAAEDACDAVLWVLGQRLSGSDAGELAAQLPQGIAAYVTTGEARQNFDFKEFISRVSAHEHVDAAQAGHHIRAVFAVLGEAVSAEEMQSLRQQLDSSYDAVFAPDDQVRRAA